MCIDLAHIYTNTDQIETTDKIWTQNKTISKNKLVSMMKINLSIVLQHTLARVCMCVYECPITISPQIVFID